MKFHEYRSMRSELLQSTRRNSDFRVSEDVLKTFSQSSSAEFRRQFLEDARNYSTPVLAVALAEDVWAGDNRPFYNVWPIATELASGVKLTLPFSALAIPFPAILLRFAAAHEPYGVTVAMILWVAEMRQVQIHAYVGDRGRRFLQYFFEPEQQVQNWLDKESSAEDGGIPTLLIRLCVFISLLAKDTDLITPLVLAKDQVKYDSTSEDDVKRWLENRAARRMGRGFNVGRTLQLDRDRSPHWRNPHLALFWVGEGRKTPVIKMRSGSVVQRVSMADVPTGYLGPETNRDDEFLLARTHRESISKSRRFALMKRDGFCCQLCGASQEDGAKLHVDHKVPRAKGGSQEDENLWTLCEDCNLGKSDDFL